jgi:hypothetical protein
MSDDPPNNDTSLPFWKIRGVIPTFLILVAIGLLIWKPSAQDDPRLMSGNNDGTPPKITRGTKKNDDSRPQEPTEDSGRQNRSAEEAKADCLIPALGSESVPSMDIVYRKDIQSKPSGGTIVPGLYRITAAHSKNKIFTAGRWSMLLDLAETGHGAYYRKLGLHPQKSRIQWKAKAGRFSFEMLCPDKGQQQFSYTVTNVGFTLITDDGFSLHFERYGEPNALNSTS